MSATQTTVASATDVANRRILRLALGTALSMGFCQLINWPLSFLSAVFTMFLLALPLPAPGWKSIIKFTLALVTPAYLAMLILLPFLAHARWTGIILVVLSLFGSFYYAARGGSPIMGMFLTVGLTLVVTVGSVSAVAMMMVLDGVVVGAVCGISFVIIAHTLLPDIPLGQSDGVKPPAPAPKPSLPEARKNAFRSLAVMLPLVFVFLFIDNSTAYVVVMIKVASMGQQASVQVSRTMGRQQLQSTILGGIGAVIAYFVMSISHSLLLFCVVIAISCLVYGKYIFQGRGMHPMGPMWSYALLTMIILITPAVASGNDLSSAFWTRLLLFVLIAIYGTAAVAIFDSFWPQKKKETTVSA